MPNPTQAMVLRNRIGSAGLDFRTVYQQVGIEVETDATPQQVARVEDMIARALAERERDERKPPHLQAIAESFYDLTVKERDYERVKCDRLAGELVAAEQSLREAREALEEALDVIEAQYRLIEKHSAGVAVWFGGVTILRKHGRLPDTTHAFTGEPCKCGHADFFHEKDGCEECPCKAFDPVLGRLSTPKEETSDVDG